MDPLLELDALSSFVQPFVPNETAIELLRLPEVPYDDMLVMRFLSEEPRMRNAWQSEHIRQWQLLYFHEQPNKVVQTASAIAKRLIHGITIPYKDESGGMWFTRVQAYSIGQPQQTDSDKWYSLSVLETKTGAVADQDQYVLMQEYIMNIGG